ncbi:hypothetical protein N7532_000364 [Penicillium argentinense]|uniref:Pre-mRNA-splicing factor n=1 Tax=Penicillium argentinense TaxID=1131581 RepID=A0A9W9KMJ9_9EURO|nr:uncharacterized protein N7532_000364 [Penicillium argentinense]KAJ5112319.1 hypothetical protein N7532_000364 [Penicillium argentinense]
MPSSSQPPGDRNGGISKPFSLSSNSKEPPVKKTAFSFQSSRSRPDLALKSGSLPRRPHQLGHDDSSDEDEAEPVHEEVSGFDTHTGGAITTDGQAVNTGKTPLVIPVTSKNNWRDRPGVNVRKSTNLLPREVQAMQGAQKNGQAPPGNEVETKGPSMAYGLSFAQKAAEDEKKGDTGGEDQPMADAKPAEDSKSLTDDQLALRALIQESTGEAQRRTDLVIESSKGKNEDGTPAHYDEAASFKTDVGSRPESATLDQYNAIPVEEFGAALLRGMGWKDGQSIGRGKYGSSSNAKKSNEPQVPAPRPGFLGIGAKDSGKGAEVEFGAWGKSAMRKASRKQGEENASGNTEGLYMPVMVRNKNTGEYITEEELAELKKKGSKPQPPEDDWRDRRDRNLEKSGRGRDRDRDYRRRDYDDERSDRRNGSSRRDRSRSAGRHSSRRSRYDDDDRRRDDQPSRDSDRDHRRARDDDRDYYKRDRDYDRERHRSRHHRDDGYSSRSSHSSRHDRDRDRDRNSHRRRRED